MIAETRERFDRQEDGLTGELFYELDQRDQGEDASYGQQVNRCVDMADVVIDNGDHLAGWQIEQELGSKVREYAALVEIRTD